MKKNCLLKTFLRTLDDSGVYLPAFSSKANLKLHSIFVTPMLVKKVTTKLDSLKVSGPSCSW